MYEAIEHWKQYKYPTKKELIAKGYEVPGAMLLEELKEYEEAQAELDQLIELLTAKNGTTQY